MLIITGTYGECRFQDCLTGMKTLPNKSFDLIFTSPPFKEEDVKGDYWDFYKEFMCQAKRIASKVLIVFHSATKLNRLIQTYPPDRTMVWGKGISKYPWRWNPILCYEQDPHYGLNAHIWNDTFGVEAVTGKWKVQKYQDPDLLYETLLKMFDDCESVLDPFIGSGTTARVCEKMQKKWLGFEIDQKNREFIANRIKLDESPLQLKDKTTKQQKLGL